MNNPIWKDIIVDITPSSASEQSVDYIIDVDGVHVFGGTAQRDTNGKMLVRINDIIAGYLFQDMPLTFNSGQGIVLSPAPNISKEVIVYVVSDSQWRTAWQDFVGYDWSYEYAASLHNPINFRIDPRMPLIWSVFEGYIAEAECEALRGDYNVDYNKDYTYNTIEDTYALQVDADSNAILPPNLVSQYDTISVDNGYDPALVYKVVKPCHRYALYYANKYGGIDFLLMEGTCKESDSITRYTHRREVRNDLSTPQRAVVEYTNVQTKKFSLKTGLLSTEESLRMDNLIGSPNVWMWDNVLMKMSPVIITDTSVEHKTYKTEGRKPIQYTINVELAQDRMRR